jgi:hypothetical protein
MYTEFIIVWFTDFPFSIYLVSKRFKTARVRAIGRKSFLPFNDQCFEMVRYPGGIDRTFLWHACSGKNMRGCRQRQKHQRSEPSIHFLIYGFYINYYSLQRLVPKRTYQLHVRVLREFKGRFPLRPYRTVTYRWACADWKEVYKSTYCRVYSRIKIKSSSQVNFLAYYGSTNQSTFTKFWNLKFVLIRYGTLRLKWKTALMVRIFQRITVMRLPVNVNIWFGV